MSKDSHQAVASWYMNASAFMYVDAVGHCKNKVTQTRVKAFDTIPSKLLTVEEFRQRHRSLHVVQQFSNNGGYLRLVCDCAGFWDTACYCSHVVSVYHHLGVINIFNMMSGLMPVRKRGRPTTREKALERDIDELDVMNIRPAAWRKTNVRHPEYRNSVVYQYRVLPDENETVVWKVPFPDVPAGI